MPIPFLDPNSREYLNPSNPQDSRMLAELASFASSTGSTQLESIHFLQSYQLMIDGHLGPVNSAGLTALLQRFQALYIDENSPYELNLPSDLRSSFRQLVNASVDTSVIPRPTELEMLHLLRDVRREVVSVLRLNDFSSSSPSTVRDYRESGYSEFRSDPARTDTLVRETLRDHLTELDPVETRGRR